MKKADPAHEITVLERNRPDDTFGFGVVFSDATLDNFREADPETHAAITQAFAHWDDVDIHYQDQVLTSTGHGFSGMSRQALLDILQARAKDLGVVLQFSSEVTDPAAWAGADLVLAADGVNSALRLRYAAHFQPAIAWRRNRFVWLGTTFPFPAFTFMFKESEHGLWRVHAYRYDARSSTFILEATEATWRRAGLDEASEDETVAFVARLFARELDGHPVLKNRSLWRSFPTVRNGRWHHDNIVLVGGPAASADVHAVPPARARAVQSRRRLADVPIFGRGRHAGRLAPRPSRQPRRRWRRPGDDRDDRREPRGPHQPRLHGHVQA